MASVLLDGTGRMFETGNRPLLRSYAREIEQIRRFVTPGVDIEWYSATDTIVRVDWDVDDEFPMNEFVKGGRLDIKSVLSFALEKEGITLLVSDGCWSALTIRDIEKVLRENASLEFYILVMGTEKSATAYRLNRRSKKCVYSGDEIFDVMEKLIQGEWRG